MMRSFLPVALLLALLSSSSSSAANASSDNNKNFHRIMNGERVLAVEQDDVSLQESIDSIIQLHRFLLEQREATDGGGERELSHTIPSVIVPRGCDYETNHVTNNEMTLIDTITCLNQCSRDTTSAGDGTFLFHVETTCPSGTFQTGSCTSTNDCIVSGCNDDCGAPGSGRCPCLALPDPNTVCDLYCPEEETPSPTSTPTGAPVAAPTDPPVPETPAPVEPETPAPVEPETPAPVVAETPAPVVPDVDIPETPPPVAEPVPAEAVPTEPVPTEAAPTITIDLPPTDTATMVAPTATPCFTNTTDIFVQALLDQGGAPDPDASFEYYLCDDTVYEIGTTTEDGSVVGGDLPLALAPHSTYKCLGKNCTFVGGSIQVFADEVLYDTTVTDSVVVEGITFVSTDPAGVPAVLGTGGDVTFTKCNFVAHETISVVAVTWDPASNDDDEGLTEGVSEAFSDGERRRHLQESSSTSILAGNMARAMRKMLNDDDDDTDEALTNQQSPPNRNLLRGGGVVGGGRQLEGHLAAETTRLTATFDRTIFAQNSRPTDEANAGIVTATTGFNDLIFAHVTFTENVYNTTDLGYAVLATDGSSIAISDSIFFDNSFNGLAPIVLSGNGTFTSTNVSGSTDDSLSCPFALTVEDSMGTGLECTDFDLEITEAPPPPEEEQSRLREIDTKYKQFSLRKPLIAPP